MVGHAHAVGFRDGTRTEAGTIARYFFAQEDKPDSCPGNRLG